MWTQLDINECENETHDCLSSDHKVCVDTNGSYVCNCKEGYRNVSDICYGKVTRSIYVDNIMLFNHADIDECEDDIFNNCSYMCMNLNGSYICICEYGYSLQDDNKTCHSKHPIMDYTGHHS